MPDVRRLLGNGLASPLGSALALFLPFLTGSPLTAQERSAEVAECRLAGRIVDAATGEPIGGASVWLERPSGVGEGLQAARTVGEDGAYLMDFIPCMSYVLRVSMLGYEAADVSVDMRGGGAYEATIRMSRAPIELEELRVEVPRSTLLADAGFYARKAWVESTGDDLADFYDPAEVEGRTRAIHTVPALYGRSRIRFIYGPGGCLHPSVYIDGRRFRAPDRRFAERLDMRVSTNDVEGVEIYRPMSTAIPMEFRDGDSASCGLVLIWTKRGRGTR